MMHDVMTTAACKLSVRRWKPRLNGHCERVKRTSKYSFFCYEQCSYSYNVVAEFQNYVIVSALNTQFNNLIIIIIENWAER